MKFVAIGIAFFTLIALSFNAYNAEIVKSIIFPVPESLSLEDAKEQAIELMKVEVLQEKGVFIESIYERNMSTEIDEVTVKTSSYSGGIIRVQIL